MDGLARVQQAAIAGLAVALAGGLSAQDAQLPASAEPPWQAFVAAGTDERGARDAFTAIGARWRVTPDALVSDDGRRLPRVPSHQVFWFAWYAQHPDTVLHR